VDATGPRPVVWKKVLNPRLDREIPTCDGYEQIPENHSWMDKVVTHISNRRLQRQMNATGWIICGQIERLDSDTVLEAVHTLQGDLLRGKGDIRDRDTQSTD
jgi:hypothetical protein